MHSSDYVGLFAWETLDRETGNRVERWKTVRRSDGVVIGEHLEEVSGYGVCIRTLWGKCDTDRTRRGDLQMWGIPFRLCADAESNNAGAWNASQLERV